MNQFSYLSRKTNILLGVSSAITLGLLLLLAGEGFLIFRAYQSIQKQNRDLGEAIAETSAFAETRSLIADTEDARDALDAYFIGEGDEIVFIEELEDIARQAGVSLSFSSIQKEADEEILSLSFRTEGFWQETMHMFALLELMPRKVRIENVTLSEITNLTGPSRWHAAFNVSLLSIMFEQ